MVSDLNKNFGGSTDLAQKWHGSADLHTPIHPPLSRTPIRRHKKWETRNCKGPHVINAVNVGSTSTFCVVSALQSFVRLYKSKILVYANFSRLHIIMFLRKLLDERS